MASVESKLQQIKQWLADNGHPDFRFTQVEAAWYSQPDWDAITTLPQELKTELAAEFPWLTVESSKIVASPKDGTEKVLFSFHDKQRIESVFMPNARGTRTICISSQVGCGMGCTFCATGTMGLVRNLTVDEVVDQIRFWRFNRPDAQITNIVYMGMGEPLANFDVVKQSANTFINQMGIGSTRITVSTVGFKMGLHRLLNDDDFPPVRVALSLHAGTDETRASIVPSHKGRSISQIATWVEEYIAKHGNRRRHLTLEYVMLKGINDMPTEAEALVKKFGHLKHQIKLNLIPWNPTDDTMKRSPDSNLHKFQDITKAAGIPTTIRYSKGLDIEAACGQLVVKTMQQEAEKSGPDAPAS